MKVERKRGKRKEEQVISRGKRKERLRKKENKKEEGLVEMEEEGRREGGKKLR